MLIKYKFKNINSFAEETEISFSVKRQSPSTDLVFESPDGSLLSKVIAVLGPNGAGKTNVLKPLVFLQWFVVHSFASNAWQGTIPIRQHFFSDVNDSEIEIEFEVDKRLYRYKVIANQIRVMHEALYIKNKESFRYLFRRKWSNSDCAYKVDQQRFGFAPGEAKKVRINASLLSTAAQYNVPRATEIVNYFLRMFTNVDFFGKQGYQIENLFDSASFFQNNPTHNVNMNAILSRLDLGLSEVVIESREYLEKGTDQAGPVSVPFGIHTNESKRIQIPFVFESGGTQRTFVLLEKILPALEHGGVVIIDELEADLHPDMIVAILDLFISPNQNPHNAQIIFTCHALEVLNELQKEQIVLVEKDSAGASEAWRMSDFKGIRRDDNLYAKYRAGAYGAVPNL